jgi:FkbM family methyltransferase
LIQAQHDAKFLDVGAYHPFLNSNTRALYELGWSGVMCEPSPKPFAALEAEYKDDPRITLLNKAVWLDNAPFEMWLSDSQMSTADEATFQKWRATEKYRLKQRVETIWLDDLYKDYGPFDFVNIDAEGLSYQLFIHGIARLPENWLPHCICVEFDSDKNLLEILKRATGELGYACTYASGENVVLVKQ